MGDAAPRLDAEVPPPVHDNLHDHAAPAVAIAFGLAAAVIDDAGRVIALAIAFGGFCFSAVHLYFAWVRFYQEQRDRAARDLRHTSEGRKRPGPNP